MPAHYIERLMRPAGNRNPPVLGMCSEHMAPWAIPEALR
jgi:hypothetical protein